MKTVYLLTGPNEVFRKDYIDKLIAKVPREELTVYFADDSSVSAIINQCVQTSLFGAQNVVLVRNIDRIKGKPADTGDGTQKSAYKSKSDEFETRLLHYLESPNPDTVLILEWESPSKKAAAAVEQDPNQIAKEFKRAYARDILDFIRGKFAEIKLDYEKSIPDLVLILSNEDIEDAAMMVRLLCEYAGDGGKLAAEDAKNILARSQNGTIFQLIDAFFTKKPRPALEILSDMKQLGDPHILVINSMLLRSAKHLWGYLASGDKRELASEMGISSFEMKKLSEYAQICDLKFVSAVFELSRAVEYRVKSTDESFAFLEIETFLLNMKKPAYDLAK
ncbi:MAG: DNA polymerase III subunit delta [Brevinematales bacterium]|nr:DNA polymerase III subunit delta [Brevinematales bacterium]